MPTKMRTKDKDPVCGMEVEVRSAPRETAEGTTYVFCSEECREKFQANPSDYTNI